MSDLISRQAVLDGIDKYIEKAQSTGTIDDFNSFAELVVKTLPSVENKGEWIPVSERLPDETKTKGHGLCHVLVTHTYAGIIRTHQAVFTQGKFLKLETYKEDNTVVAWMPLPEPYKKGGE